MTYPVVKNLATDLSHTTFNILGRREIDRNAIINFEETN